MKKTYIKPEERVIILSTSYNLLTISGDSLGKVVQPGADYSRGLDWDDDDFEDE